MLVKQAANVLELLEYFARHKQPATMAEISDSLGWPRSSTFNLVATLAEKGYLYEPRQRGGYYPSSRWMSTVKEIAAADPLPASLVEAIAAIQAKTGETTAVGQAAGAYVIFVHVCESQQPIRYFAQAGTRVPIHASSAGRAILVQCSQRERDAIYRRITFKDFSTSTPMSAEAVEAELKEAGQRGYHCSNSEYIPDLAGVALPIELNQRKLSVVVAGPTSRCLSRQSEIAKLMKQELVANQLIG
ncbi:IclR family transcriptional regulator [Tianweitania populi]|uniref:Transcriptional regulator n=1 Tax=Tianweitania populi TaxID=1607949 RepID=A0A8J3GJQ3_9HYPH|nr:helix-turn-helix domain-containing protein [Tianweitania populi]GHD13127.1 transcriptional regulator [Tianweitania populi]